MKVVLVLVLVLVLDPEASADEPVTDRVGHLALALDAVHGLGPAGRDQLARDLYDASRTRCHADVATPTTACLVEAARALCRDDSCKAAADVIVANLRASPDWIDEATRAKLVRSSADYRAALFGELQHRFGALAAELALANGRDAAAIDKLCRERDRAVHACRDDDPTCVPSLPWSRCAAALVWFVGSAK
jgi:hypothetical protein